MDDSPDPAAQAILEKAATGLFPSSHALTPTSARQRLEDLFATQPAEDVANTAEFSIQGPASELPVRLYEPDADPPYPILVFFHGGGFVAGSLDTHENICAALTNRADCLTISVDYRLAPEDPFPAAVEDCYAALEWAAEHADQINGDADRIAIAGDSAGGNLAAATTHMARDQDGPALQHQALIYPAVASPVVHDFESYETNGEGYLLEKKSTDWYISQYVQSDAHLRNAYLAPLLASDFTELPPATVVTAGFDLHRDEGFAYSEALAEAGVAVDHHNFEEMIHAFVSLPSHISQGEAALDEIGANLREAF